MKNILKYILCFAFCVGVICATTTTVNAEETEENIICDSAFEIGDTIYYQCANKHDTFTLSVDAQCTVDSSNLKICFYLESGINSPSGYQLAQFNTPLFSKLDNSGMCSYIFDNGDPTYSFAGGVNTVRPYWYHIYGGEWPRSNLYFRTNIPIFQSKAEAQEYVNGARDINTAINYKKTMENGSWVKPFEDIEINDSSMSSPQLANVSHSGFTVVNVPDERYMVDVYLESGIQNPLPYEISLTSIGDALFVNSFGLVSDTEGAFTGEIDLLSCYGVDNISALNDSVSQFYSTYPSINAFNDSLPMDTLKVNKPTWSIWGQPFGKSFVFFTKSTSATGTVSADNCPLAYTNYKVRYFYYDDDSGFHYGPWTNFIYFSDGRVMRGEVFQGNDGNIIESPFESGTQDSSGNVSMNYGSLVDIENPNELFGYLRSLINNINATGNNFMTLFGTVFSFLPSDLLAIIWLGIGCMILIGIIRAFN